MQNPVFYGVISKSSEGSPHGVNFSNLFISIRSKILLKSVSTALDTFPATSYTVSWERFSPFSPMQHMSVTKLIPYTFIPHILAANASGIDDIPTDPGA